MGERCGELNLKVRGLGDRAFLCLQLSNRLKTKVKKERKGKCRKIINSTARAIAGLRLTLYITTVGSLTFARNVSEPPFPKNHLFSCTKTNEVSFAVSPQCFPLEEASSGAGGQLTSHGKGSSGTLGYILYESCVAVGRVLSCRGCSTPAWADGEGAAGGGWGSRGRQPGPRAPAHSRGSSPCPRRGACSWKAKQNCCCSENYHLGCP